MSSHPTTSIPSESAQSASIRFVTVLVRSERRSSLVRRKVTKPTDTFSRLRVKTDKMPESPSVKLIATTKNSELDKIEGVEDSEDVICAAARQDYKGEWIGNETFEEIMAPIDGDTLEEKKKHLIQNTLLKHGHFGPLEHAHATFTVEGVSRSLMAQLTRHRHATFDIQSMRYVSFNDKEPEVGEIVVSIPELESTNIAGRNAEMDAHYKEMDEESLLKARQNIYEMATLQAYTRYNELLSAGVAPENARMILPIGTKIDLSFTVNARMLLHIADMRAQGDAQWEIREMTESVLSKAEDWIPHTMEYYNAEMANRKNRLAP